MNTLENVYQIAFISLGSVGVAVAIIVALASWLGKVWANRILESDRARYAEELNKASHKLNIELDQLSIVHEYQKSSFQRLIKALRESIRALEQNFDEEWQPISEQTYGDLKEIVIEESLFLGAEGETALNIYLNFLNKAVFFPDDPLPEDKILRNIYEFLDFISERIREYFRKRIGLAAEESPLLDVKLIAACLLINENHFRENDRPIPSTLKFQFDLSPSALVDTLKDEVDKLRDALELFVSILETDSNGKKYYFQDLAEARSYLKLLEEAQCVGLFPG